MSAAGTLTFEAAEHAAQSASDLLRRMMEPSTDSAKRAGVRLGLEIGAVLIEDYVRDCCDGFLNKGHAAALLARARELRAVEVPL